MTTKLIVILAGVLLLTCKATKKSSIISSRSYYPLEVGHFWKYQFYSSKETQSVKIIETTDKINRRKYFKIIRKYSWNNRETQDFARNEDGNIYSYDNKTNDESILIPSVLEVGKTWFQTDKSWRYEIVSINAVLETPKIIYDSLLHIKATQLTKRDADKLSVHDLFYKKGKGLVGTMGDGKLMTYLIN